ncbi:MAG: nucleotidyltransferase domain-containing protein [Clostridiales bacterium]|nr:nucleotidyltransferase domain-containing protein [Clostridiales bacterium]
MYRFKRIEHNILEYIPSLVEKLKNDKDIVAIYLFGSYAEKKQTSASDVDLGGLLDQDFSPKQYFDKKLELLSEMTSLLKTDEVDLVILNDAPPVLSYRILSQGELLFEKENEKSQRVEFQVQTYNRYFDFIPIEKIIHEGLVRRIREGRFGG